MSDIKICDKSDDPLSGTPYPCTVFVDVDGCIFIQDGNTSHQLEGTEVVQGIKEIFNEWSSLGYRIVITTARKESARKQTEDQLKEAGFFWDVLLMGLGAGQRILINDLKPGKSHPMAIALNVERNKGFSMNDIKAAAKSFYSKGDC